MGRVRARGEEIRRYILQNVQANPKTISKLAVREFKVSRQAINTHLRRLIQEGSLHQSGKTNNHVYELAVLLEWNQIYHLAEGLEEDLVWRNGIDNVLGKLPDNVRSIWHYGFTEMFNNAIDHAEGSTITVVIKKTAVTSEMMIMDDGVGIFRKIQQQLELLDERHAIFELSKGKLTTDPQHHTGEGIFFASRVFNGFSILSGGVFFSHDFERDEDWLLEQPNRQEGTTVFMRLNNHTSRTMKEIFDKFTGDSDDRPEFNKTVVPVKLAQYGNDSLISRSQAKRVLARFNQFSIVLLDFKEVETIGQAFADEVFRIFPVEHPEVEVIPINSNLEVTRMIARAQAPRAVSNLGPSGISVGRKDPG